MQVYTKSIRFIRDKFYIGNMFYFCDQRNAAQYKFMSNEIQLTDKNLHSNLLMTS